MGKLSETWFADGYIDFELKKYTLLSYLQEIHRAFNQNKLYPQLADIIFHFNNLRAFQENKQLMEQQFPKRLTGIDLEKLLLLYEKVSADDELMEELEEIIAYALEAMNDTIRDGTEIYEFVQDKLRISPVGLVPLENTSGYLLLCDGRYSDTLVYSYHLTIFERHDEQYRGIRTEYLEAYTKDLIHTCEHIKTILIRKNNQLPNPAVYCVETSLVLPVNETLLPVAKRSLVRYIALNAA